MPPIADFDLKRFFNEGLTRTARLNLSSSFIEPIGTEVLLALEPDAAARLQGLSLGYTTIHGGADLRAAIARQYTTIAPEQILAACGADDILPSLFLALVNPGDHLIVQSPIYQPLTAVAEWRGGTISHWHAEEGLGWEPPLAALDRMIRPSTRFLVVNFPHSPTGFAPTAAYLDALLSWADGAGIVVICDEIYRGLPLANPIEAPSAADRSARAVVLGGLSKVFGLPGLRVGWLATRNESVLAAVKHLRMHFNTYIGAPNEFLATLALRHRDHFLAQNRALARANLADLAAFIDQHSSDFSWQPPQAGVVAYPRWLGVETTTELSAHLLRKYGLLLAPSTYFAGGERHMRLGFGTSTLTTGLAQLASAMGDEAIA